MLIWASRVIHSMYFCIVHLLSSVFVFSVLSVLLQGFSEAWKRSVCLYTCSIYSLLNSVPWHQFPTPTPNPQSPTPNPQSPIPFWRAGGKSVMASKCSAVSMETAIKAINCVAQKKCTKSHHFRMALEIPSESLLCLSCSPALCMKLWIVHMLRTFDFALQFSHHWICGIWGRVTESSAHPWCVAH